MARGLLRLVLAAILAVVTAVSMSITGYLSMLEKGMGQNLQAVQREVVAQKSIQAQNAALGHMVAVTKGMDGRVTAMAGAADAILINIRKVGDANRAVMGFNSQLVKNGTVAADQLKQVSGSLDEMNASAREVVRSLESLSKTVQTQRQSLDSVLWYVTGMNARTPRL